ncbi:MAG: OsmC family protein [Nesterenkonia sp.]|nr:OsmC family protein [Nesterenkonia sp.]
MTRVGPHHYRARNAAGAELDFGRGEGLLTPVELLLAAIAGCSSVDVDTVVSRRSEFTGYDVSAEGTKVQEDGASRLTGIRLHFDLSFPDDESGRRAAGMVDRVVQLSHDKNCTVSRTVEMGEPVAFTTDVTLDTADDTTDDGTDD